tara:strand:- start:43 stop:444 length:402 start_codon:yes stop_codon:yes gene_type:complete
MSNGRIEDTLMTKFVLGEDYVKELRMNYPWVERAVSSGLRYEDPKTEEIKSVFTITVNIDGQDMVIPTVRRKRDEKGTPLDELEELSDDEAIEIALKNRDFIPAPSPEAAEYISRGFSNYQGMRSEYKQPERE